MLRWTLSLAVECGLNCQLNWFTSFLLQRVDEALNQIKTLLISCLGSSTEAVTNVYGDHGFWRIKIIELVGSCLLNKSFR